MVDRSRGSGAYGQPHEKCEEDSCPVPTHSGFISLQSKPNDCPISSFQSCHVSGCISGVSARTPTALSPAALACNQSISDEMIVSTQATISLLTVSLPTVTLVAPVTSSALSPSHAEFVVPQTTQHMHTAGFTDYA